MKEIKYVVCNCGQEVSRLHEPGFFGDRYYSAPEFVGYDSYNEDEKGNIICPNCGEIIGEADFYDVVL